MNISIPIRININIHMKKPIISRIDELWEKFIKIIFYKRKIMLYSYLNTRRATHRVTHITVKQLNTKNTLSTTNRESHTKHLLMCDYITINPLICQQFGTTFRDKVVGCFFNTVGAKQQPLNGNQVDRFLFSRRNN